MLRYKFKIIFHLVVWLLFQAPVFAQKTLSLDEFLSVVRNYHPVAQQAKIQVEISKAELQSSKGAFDPAFYINQNQKELSNKSYYNYASTELKIPTWYGIDFKAGTENNRGLYTSNELTLGKSSFVGLQASLGKGLLIDKRRATVMQAKQMVGFSEEEKKLALNELLYDACVAYFEWQNAFQQKVLIDSVLANNRQRYAFTKSSYLLGDRPAIDTTEALTQLQNFEYLQAEAAQNLANAAYAIGNFLWKEQQMPYQLPFDVMPQITNLNPVFSLENYLNEIAFHPKIQQAKIKLEVLDIEKRLKFQSLLPTFNVQYNVLNKGYTFFQNATLFQNNYKWGFTLGMPLLLREGRADYSKAKLKISQQNWQNSLLINELSNKVRSYYNDATQLRTQLTIYQQNVGNYQKLYEGELIKFKNGESSLFLLNSREMKLFEAKQKLASLYAKASKSIMGVQYAAGTLWK